METFNKNLKAVLLLMGIVLFTMPTFATLYEDAENNVITGWITYGDTTDATIENVVDSEKGSRVIKLTGNGKNTGFRLGNKGGRASYVGAWHNQTEKLLKWSMKYDEPFRIYIPIRTEHGNRFLTYTNQSVEKKGKIRGGKVSYGLGEDSIDGTWHTFSRDLEADWNAFMPNDPFVAVNGFFIKGSGVVDDIMTITGDNPLIANAGADQELNITTPSTTVTLDGTASTVGSGASIVQYEWLYNGVSLGTGATLAVDDVEPGTYTVTLTVTDSLGNTASDTVKVKVTLVDEVSDTTKPIITLLGDNPVTLTVGDTYTDAGATAMDDVDGNITANIQVTGLPINTSSEGNYTITYSVADLAGNVADTITRKINIIANTPALLTKNVPLVPANCQGHITKSGVDTNGNGVLDDNEITSSEEHYDNGTPITRENLMAKIGNGDDVTQVNTCKITDMSHLFNGADHLGFYPEAQRETVRNFNQDISGWDVSNVTNMGDMFYDASSFNQPLNNWDVSKVTNMRYMFLDASTFNQPLDKWDVSNVTDMGAMFFGASSFNQPLNNWDVSNVTDMYGMFYGTSTFNQPLDKWDVSNVTDIGAMFYGASTFNQPLNNWDVSNVTNMTAMFSHTSSFNQPLDNWDVSNVTDMDYMFANTSSFNQPLNNWDVSNVTKMDGMFYSASSFNQPLDKWDVSKVTDMGGMFMFYYGASTFNQPLNNWDVSNVTDMGYMFYNASSFSSHDLSNWDVSNVTNHHNFSVGSGSGNTEPNWN